MNLNVKICKAFGQQASEYEKAAKIQTEIGSRLFERLNYLKINPRYILDLGCGTGLFSLLLKKKYPKAEIIGLDLSAPMLKQAKQKQSWRRRWPLIKADMSLLPFDDRCFDLIFANQVVHWTDSFKVLAQELNRVMRLDGCLMFSTLGPDTFKEFQKAWEAGDKYAHVNRFSDMHDIGDQLLSTHFIDPVVDMELLTVHYTSVKQLLENLKAQGISNTNPSRNRGLTGKKSWQHFESAYQNLSTSDGKYPLSYEVVYAHAWKGRERPHSIGNETFIPVSQIRSK